MRPKRSGGALLRVVGKVLASRIKGVADRLLGARRAAEAIAHRGHRDAELASVARTDHHQGGDALTSTPPVIRE